jgi:hypothetical protein
VETPGQPEWRSGTADLPFEDWRAPQLGQGMAGPPPPETMTLSMATSFYPGAPYSMTVTGSDVAEGDTIRILIGRSPTEGRCFPSGICTGVDDIAVSFLGIAETPDDPFGGLGLSGFGLGFPLEPQGSFSGYVPPNFADGTYYVQAYNIRGGATVASNIVTITVDHCSSGRMRVPWDVQRVADCTSLPSLFFEDTFTGPAAFPVLATLSSLNAQSSSTGVTSIDLPVLTDIRSGDMRGASSLVTFNAPSLRTVEDGWNFDLRNSPIDTIDLTALEVTGNYFGWPTLAGDPDLPSLRSVGHSIDFNGVVGMTDLYLPALEDARYLDVADNPALVTFEAPLLEEGSVLAIRNPVLETVDLPSFERVRHWLQVEDNPQLVTLTHGPNPTVLPSAPSNAPIYLQRNGSWCYDVAMDWTPMTTGERIDRCP